MYKLKKLPSIITAIVLIIIILISAFEKASLNVLSIRIIIFGIIFYFLGFILENFLNSAIKEIETQKFNSINNNENNHQKSGDVDIMQSENSDKESENQSEKIMNDTEEKA